VSYSFREPEEPVICECKYDGIKDRMDRDDCPIHASQVDDAHRLTGQRKQAANETRTTNLTGTRTA